MLGPRSVATAPPAPARALLAAALAASLAAPAYAVPAAVSLSRAVVTAVEGVDAAADAVVAAGGKVLHELSLVGGVVARLPRNAVLPSGVTAVPDRALHVTGASADTTGSGGSVRAALGLPASGTEGSGVTVAVVDTGVADVPDLAGTVTHRDVTGEGTGDGYGHGTFMAGLVAGSGAASDGRYAGVAPGAHVLDVRVAGSDGATSLSLVLRGLQVVGDDDDVDVLSLSLSSGSPLPYQVDPLTRALEALWQRGITVVVAAGNDGPDRRTITSPGVDPTVLTVGAVDGAGTAARDDDTVPSWSSRGPAPEGVAKPDLVGPGSHVVSLRAPGSAVDAANPGSRVDGAYFRGSGTSMATAVTSGAVAALLAARPDLTPDQVKSVLMRSAYGAPGLGDVHAAGRGGLDLLAAYGAQPGPATWRGPDIPDEDAEAWAEFARAWAAGDWDATARAWARLSPQARAWAARAWAAAVWSRAGSWSDADWNARAWAARAWAVEDWLARAWAARAWADVDWAARAWAARAWAARAWSARAWAARAWSARAWSARAWSDEDWAARAWSARAWSDEEWAARAWSARAWSARAWSDEEWAARAWSARAWSGEAWTARAWSARAWSARSWAAVGWVG